MSMVKRIFRQQSARVASTDNRPICETPSVTSSIDPDADEEEKFGTACTTDDTALILSRRQKVLQRAPLHSNSFVCIFTDRKGANFSRQSKKQQDEDSENFKHRSLIFRSSFPPTNTCCLRSSTAPIGQLAVIGRDKSPRKSIIRTATFDDICQLNPSDGYRLTRRQRTVISECWKEAKKRSRSGETIGSFVFRWLFKHQPRLKLIFDLAEIDNDRLENDYRFQKYSQNFTNVLEMVVDSVSVEQDLTCSLDDTMGPFLCSYGAKHASIERRNRSKYPNSEFRLIDWELLAVAIREFILDSARINNSWPPLAYFHKRNEILHAWHILVQFIVTKIRRGYELEKERICNELDISSSEVKVI